MSYIAQHTYYPDKLSPISINMSPTALADGNIVYGNDSKDLRTKLDTIIDAHFPGQDRID
jgi:hypothetical protein